MAEVVLGIAGVSHIHFPGYLAMLKERRDVRVKHVWDPQPERARRRAEELGAPVAGSLEGLLGDPEVHAVLVCSETDRHRDIVLAAAGARKHVFVEKPLGLGTVDSREMAEAVERAGVLFQTGLGKRSTPNARFLSDQIRLGHLGKLTRVRVSVVHGGALRDGKFSGDWAWMADAKQAGGGGFFDLGAHGLDLMLWLLGEVESATGSIGSITGRYPNCDEFGEGLLKFRSGVVGTLAAGWVDVTDPLDLAIWGTEGQACVTRDDVLFYKSAHVPGADGKSPWTDLPPVLSHPIQRFMDALGGKKEGSLIPVREAAYACAVMEALYKGAREGRWVRPGDVGKTQ